MAKLTSKDIINRTENFSWGVVIKSTRMLLLVAAFSFCSPVFALDFPHVPNEEWTKGSLCTIEDPDFESYAYVEQIAKCRRNVTSAQKKSIYSRYGVPENCRAQYTIDHFIPLSMGGTNNPDNLWPEHKSVKETRMDLEYEVYLELKEGAIKQDNAIETVVTEKVTPTAKSLPKINCYRQSKGTSPEAVID